ncbi:MAG: hypothetical protein WBQ18_12460 [Solirubrobacteraceae bacterium]
MTGFAAVLFAPPALAGDSGGGGTAPAVSISIGCSGVSFTYTNFPAGSVANPEVVVINGGTPIVRDSVPITGASFVDVIAISAQNGDVVSASTATRLPDGSAGPGISFIQKTESGCTPPCPSGTKLNFRWHYTANGSSGSWSGTKTAICPSSVTMGPQAMEGDLKVSPGTALSVGYDFTSPGNNRTFSVTVSSPAVVFTVHCVSGASPSQTTFRVGMPTSSYTVPNSQWYPSGSQSSVLVLQGSAQVPNLCGGGQVRLDSGGTFSAGIS